MTHCNFYSGIRAPTHIWIIRLLTNGRMIAVTIQCDAIKLTKNWCCKKCITKYTWAFTNLYIVYIDFPHTALRVHGAKLVHECSILYISRCKYDAQLFVACTNVYRHGSVLVFLSCLTLWIVGEFVLSDRLCMWLWWIHIMPIHIYAYMHTHTLDSP